MNGNRIIREDLKFIAADSVDWERFTGKNILISGAAGFLGSYLVESLLFLIESGRIWQTGIYAVVRDERKAKARLASYIDHPQLHILAGDVNLPIDIPVPLHFIIHAASQASPKYYGTDPVGTLNANVLGTSQMLSLAVANPVESFLYFSSGEVYGSLEPEQIPTRESDMGFLDPMQVRSCYAESKRMGETMCVSWMHQYKVPVKIVRPFHTYGPGMPSGDGRVHADFVEDIVHGRNIVMRSDGSAIRAFCYVADATKGFFRVLLQGKDGEAYNVGNNHCEMSIKDLAGTLVRLFPEKHLSVMQSAPALSGYLPSRVSRISPDIAKIKSLGWIPVTGIEEGFHRTVESYG